jgi:hypothetical protein
MRSTTVTISTSRPIEWLLFCVGMAVIATAAVLLARPWERSFWDAVVVVVPGLLLGAWLGWRPRKEDVHEPGATKGGSERFAFVKVVVFLAAYVLVLVMAGHFFSGLYVAGLASMGFGYASVDLLYASVDLLRPRKAP